MNIVYKLINGNGEIEYIGHTLNLKSRLVTHLTSKKSKFLGRKDLLIIPIKQFHTRKEAYDYQCELQKELGFVTDREKSIKGSLCTCKKVLCFDYYTNQFISEYNSVSEAARNINVRPHHISRVLNSKRRVKSYKFITNQ